jgi:CheY-like chemotaxis protein
MRFKEVLYAEDSPDDVIIFELALKRASLPLHLHQVHDGEEAIAWLCGDGHFADRTKYPLPDILILDLKMPRKSGFDVLEWLRESKRFERMPVVILSSSDDPRDLKRAEELGVTKYFRKSADSEDVIAFLGSK